ncbi:MAG: M23 family metallopeptidase [Dermatophilaceae bacterium]
MQSRLPPALIPSSRRPRSLRLLVGSVLWLAVLVGVLIAAPRSPALSTALAEDAGVTGTATAHRDDGAAWSWPLEPFPAIRRAFDPPESRYGQGHRGVDLGAKDGQPVHVVDAGTVTHSGMVAGRGTVTVRHAGGLESTYEPLVDRVATGTVVQTGAVVGVVSGPGHCAGTACLHLGARLGEDYLDPMLLLGRVRIVLLPLLD